MTLTTSQREARSLRGRKGVDVWEQFVNLPRDKKRAYLIRQGVPEHRLTETLAELYAILWGENIRQSV
jgi:hypothetical protein